MPVDVLGYLHSKGLNPKRADKWNVNFACPFCNESESKRGRLYINTDEDADVPGLFYCHLCGEHGSLRKIQRHFGDPVDDSKDPGVTHYDLKQDAASYFHKALNRHPEAVRYYEDRGLEHDTIRRFKLGWADGKVVPHLKSLGYSDHDIRSAGFVRSDGNEFYNQVHTIPYFVGKTCVGIRLKEPGGKYRQPSGWVQRPFNVDDSYGADELILTEGEFDCMIAIQMGYKSMGVPGAAQWQDGWNDYVKDVKRVWAVFDNDSAGRKGIDRIKEKVGPKIRGLTVPPKPGGDDEDANDLSDWIVEQKHTAEDFANLLKRHKGGLLISVREAMESWEEIQGVEGLKFGFERLDTLLHPGLLPGQVVIALAKTNTGKTLWLINCFERMAMANDNLKFLFMSLEQTSFDWFERAQRIRALYTLDQNGPDSYEEAEIEAFTKRIKDVTFRFWEDRMMLTEANRMTEEHIRQTLDDYVMEMGALPDVLAIDYLGYLARGFGGKDHYEKTSAAVMALKALAKEYRIPILTPHQVNRSSRFGQKIEIDSARDAGTVEETGDFVFTLHNPDHGKTPEEPKTGKVNLEIGKSRHGGKSQELWYQFGGYSLAMVPQDDKAHVLLASQELSVKDQMPWQHAMCWLKTGKRF